MSRHAHPTPFSRLALSLMLFCLLLLMVTPLWAVEIKGLYEVEVAVEGQSAGQRRTAIREAFRQVLVKVTGNRALLNERSLRKSLRNASRYVQQYRYRIVERAAVEVVEAPVVETLEEDLIETEQVTEVDLPIEPERLLWVRFDATAVNRLLREKRLPIWGSARPSVLVWLSQEQRGERTMLLPEMLPEMVKAVEAQAKQRGLVVMLPLMDMEDHQQLPVSTLWGGFAETIQRASSRYGVEVTLTGQLLATESGQWQVEWRLYQDASVEAWIGAEGELSEIVAQGVDQMSSRLAERYTQAAEDDSLSQLQVIVTGIDDLAGYAKVTQYFSSLVMVEQIVLQTMDINSGEFLLNVRGGVETLIQGVKLGTVLQHLVDTPEDKTVAEIDASFEGPFLPEFMTRVSPTFRLR
ncbi:MAG: DUF2066 domain-containing protein [Candidatus Polarisedimenticolaceae bacterium]|nr:DUF2066 domain-containing protein [Candidatus Polarisedimenticolaceae bacterium]